MQLKDYQIVFLGIFIALGSIFSTYILSKSIVEFQKLQNQTIRVTGSASEKVTSDSAAWTMQIKTKSPTLKEGYAKLASDSKIIKKFFLDNGINSENISFGTINSYENYQRLPNGYTTNIIESYNIYQHVTVKSNDINQITKLAKNVDTLINKDITLTSENVQYFVSNLDDLKVKMVGEAAKNAKARAQSMVSGTNAEIGVMNSAKMGVFQIVPENSTDVSDSGFNDTTSINKKIIATVTATFTVK